MKKIIILVLVIVSFNFVNAQIEENPINLLAKRTAENKMLGVRFLKDFIFIKNNIYQKKTKSDLDKSIALFDENLNNMVMFLPKDKDVEKNYLKLQNFWNTYRLLITDFKKENIKKVVYKSLQFYKLLDKFNNSLLENHPSYDKYKKKIKKINKITNSNNEMSALSINYVLSRGMKLNKLANEFGFDIGDIQKKLKKFFKAKKLPEDLKEIKIDLDETVKNVEAFLNRDSYQPKLIYSYSKSFSNKSFQLINNITKN